MLIDTHCHLNRLSLPEADSVVTGVTPYLERARQAGVSRFLTVSVNLDEVSDLKAICYANDDVKMSVGLHPCEPTEALISVSSDKLVKLASSDNSIIAIGETGLDYHYQSQNKEQQQYSFIEHLKAAKQTGKPVIIHTREAKRDTIDILAKYNASGILHCFTEDWDMAKQALDLGLYISFSGIVSFKKAIELHDVCRKMPLDRILIETDSPYLAPVPMRGKENQPAWLPYVADAVASLHSTTREQIGERSSENFDRLLKEAAAQ